jgi:tetraacyldisaccharide-1-P 4'-kinase
MAPDAKSAEQPSEASRAAAAARFGGDITIADDGLALNRRHADSPA